jgi:plastocyanin
LKNRIAILFSALSSGVSAADVSVQLKDSARAPLVDAVVFIAAEGASIASTPTTTPVTSRSAPARRLSVTQRNRLFEPYVTVVQKGTAIDFPNADDMLHHVYSLSPAKRFEIKLYQGTPAAPIVFDTPGIVAVGCNLHDWMSAYILVLDTPYFAKTDAKGGARISDLPQGNYRLLAWAPGSRQEQLLQTLNVTSNDAIAVEHTLTSTVRARPKAPPRDPSRY